jgi:hypothetical protein
MEGILFKHEESCVGNADHRLCLAEDHQENWHHFAEHCQSKEDLLKTINPVEVTDSVIIYSYCIFVAALDNLATFMNALRWVSQTTAFTSFVNVNLVGSVTLGHAI